MKNKYLVIPVKEGKETIYYYIVKDKIISIIPHYHEPDKSLISVDKHNEDISVDLPTDVIFRLLCDSEFNEEFLNKIKE